jgi:hypothetical protein
MGGFQFQESNPKMFMHGVPMSEHDILPNCTNNDTMEKSSRGFPFRGGQEMHVSTLRALIHLCSALGSLVVTMNSNTSMSFYIPCAISKQQYVLLDD